jgi:hypothetical protein
LTEVRDVEVGDEEEDDAAAVEETGVVEVTVATGEELAACEP